MAVLSRHRLSGTLSVAVRLMVHDEFGAAMREHQSTINNQIVSTLQAAASRAATPAPTRPASAGAELNQQRTQLLALLRQGHINEAFQQVCFGTYLLFPSGTSGNLRRL